MIRKVNVCAVGQIQSGTSQSTGNAWRKQEFVVEWYESPSDTQSQKIVLSVMNDNIEKLKVQVGDKMEVRFDLRYREYNGITGASTPYEMRHTFVSITDEMPIALKKIIVGHSENMDTEGIYGHKKAGDLDKAAVYVDSAFASLLNAEN